MPTASSTTIRLVDEVVLWEPESWLKLGARKFDVALNIDKAANSCAFIMSVNAAKKAGYGLNDDGVIVPLNREAEYNYRLGLNDHLKFRVNQKPNTQLLTEAMGLAYRRDDYILNLSDAEQAFCRTYRREVVDRESEVRRPDRGRLQHGMFEPLSEQEADPRPARGPDQRAGRRSRGSGSCSSGARRTPSETRSSSGGWGTWW